jgi:hypothetical protein
VVRRGWPICLLPVVGSGRIRSIANAGCFYDTTPRRLEK